MAPLERLESPEDTSRELLTLNMGPHHPATHGVLRLLVTLDGEVVRDLKPIIGYVHTGIEKTAEDKSLLEGHPGRRADGLPRLLLQRDGLLRRDRDAAGGRGPAARAVPARHPHGAQPDHEPPRVARHERAGPRRDVDVLVLLPRPRADPRPLRAESRGQRMHTRYFQVGGVAEDIPRGWVEKVREFTAADARAAPTSTTTCWRTTRSSCSACAASARWASPSCARSASPARCCAPPATRGTCARRCPTAPTSTSTSRSRSASTATTGTASPCASPRSTSR